MFQVIRILADFCPFFGSAAPVGDDISSARAGRSWTRNRVHLPEVIGAVKILRQTIGPEIRLVTRLSARDAMAAGETLCIEAENRPTAVGVLPPGLASDDHVVVSVSDTGTSMNRATLERPFEPFFTTKYVGRGSGLG